MEQRDTALMVLMIDNYDSFTYNLVQYCGELGFTVQVARNDAIDLATIRTLRPSHIIVSPGPCTPNEAGISLAVVRELATEFPILGVCLGHQSIGQAYGGRVVHARQVMHGKTSPIHHRGTGLFRGIPNQFIATRYHSLVIEKRSCPECLEVTAWTTLPSGEIDEIMGVRHRERPLYGVQFHPEAILTEHGHHLLKNFFEQVA
jgi:anthranilate synthase component 2